MTNYDEPAGQRTRLTHPDASWWTYQYDTLGRFTMLRDSANRALVLDQYRINRPRQTRVRESNAPDNWLYYDAAWRLNRMWLDHPVTNTYDVNRQWTFNPADQAVTEQLDNALYPWTGHPAATSQVDYAADGLNLITVASFGANANAYNYDANGTAPPQR